MDFSELIKKRASVRNYYPRPIKIEKVIEAIEAANLAPSPGNLPILSYIIVQDSQKIQKIAEACQQKFIKNAPIVVVICSDKKKTEIMYEERTKKYIQQHAGAAIENMLLKITDLGLVSCWIGAFSDFMIRETLDIPEEIEIEAILPVAQRAKTDKTNQRQKLTINNRIFFETWRNKFQKIQKIRREDV